MVKLYVMRRKENMVTMIRNFFRHLWESIKNLKRNGWMTFASITSVTVTLALLGLFVSVLLNTEKLASDVENNVRINTYLAVDSKDSSETIQNEAGETVVNADYHKVYKDILKISGVKSIDFSSKENELKKLKETYGDVWSMYDNDSNPLQDIYIVETKSPSQVKKVAKKIKSLEGVESVNYGGIQSDKLFKITKFIRTWGVVGAAIFILMAIFLISNTIRMTIMNRKRDIEIMRLVGAKNSYIRGPFFFEGAWIGLVGAIIPSVLMFYLYHFVYSEYSRQLQPQGLSLYQPSLFLPALIGGLFIIGIIIGSIGSVFSMRRYLKI